MADGAGTVFVLCLYSASMISAPRCYGQTPIVAVVVSISGAESRDGVGGVNTGQRVGDSDPSAVLGGGQ